jgi:FkbM family methyltransferase
MLVRSRRIRALGRHVPGLTPLYFAATKWLLLRRGVGTLDYRGASLRVRTTGEEVVHLRLRPVTKEPWTVEWIEQQLRPDDVLYDIGANVGSYSLIAASVAKGRARVVAFEPGFANYASLCENIVLNGFGEAITPVPIALAERRRLASFTYRDISPGAATHDMDVEATGAYRQPVLAFDLDGLIGEFDLPAPTLVKLDVDGAEALVLAGARATLRRPELRGVLVEVENAVTDDVLRELGEAGFDLVRRIDERYGERLPDLWYGIFERR